MSVSNGVVFTLENSIRAGLGVQFTRGPRTDRDLASVMDSQVPDKLTVSMFPKKLNNSPILVNHSIIRYDPGILQRFSET